MKLKISSLLIFIIISGVSSGQYINPIPTAVPVLSINPDARLGGFANIGVVSPSFYKSKAVNSNPGLFNRDGRILDVSFSYMPYLRDIIDGVSIRQIGASFKINNKNSISIQLKYFDLGNITFTDVIGNVTGTFHPRELSQDIRFTHAINEHWSGGIGVKYILSDLAGGQYVQGSESKAMNSFAADFGTEYVNNIILDESTELNYSFGLAVLNFGPRVSYTANAEKDFIPTNLQLGFLFEPKFKIDQNTTLTFDLAYQLEKQLVPSPPLYLSDENGLVINDDGDQIIEFGKDPDISPFTALYQSFYDAPDGFTGELNEIVHRVATEMRLSHNNIFHFALRYGVTTGYLNDENININTIGVGFGVMWFTIDYRRAFISDMNIPTKHAISVGIELNNLGTKK